MLDRTDLARRFDEWKLPAEHWAILLQIAQMEEWQRRDVLRPHQEVGYWKRGDAPSTYFERERYLLQDLRSNLDKALEALTYIEIGLQLGLKTASQDGAQADEEVLAPQKWGI